MKLTATSPGDRVRRFLSTAPEFRGEVERLVGDASNRAYFRVRRPAGADDVILALLPEPFSVDALPFLDTGRLLEALDIRVPRVLATAGESGVLVLEDLGDELLQDAVAGASPTETRKLYRGAIDVLARLQRGAGELDEQDYSALRTRFDADKFVWELEFFREHFLEGHLGRTITDEERLRLTESFESIAAELVAQPYVLCHRDFHARNLMVARGELVVIDFQDARMGPRAYDLVSLLGDSYVRHSTGFVAEMRDYFEERTGVSIRDSYDVVALQRNLKALGTFGFQIARRGNRVYAPYVGPTLALVSTTLARAPRFEGLRRILSRHCEEIEG